MLGSNSKSIRELIFNRIYKIHEEILPHDEEYCELGIPAEILQQLFGNLTPEEQKVLDDYEVKRNPQINRQDQLIYSWDWWTGFCLVAGWTGAGGNRKNTCPN